MSYSDGTDVTYTVAAHDFGAGAFSLEVMANGNGVLKRVEISNVTEAFTNDTTAALIRVGYAADPDAQCEVDLGTTAIGSGAVFDEQSTGMYGVPINDDNNPVLIAGVAPTGGTPAGIADVQVTIRWFS